MCIFTPKFLIILRHESANFADPSFLICSKSFSDHILSPWFYLFSARAFQNVQWTGNMDTRTGHKDAGDKTRTDPAINQLGFLQRQSLPVMVNYLLVSREFVDNSTERQ